MAIKKLETRSNCGKAHKNNYVVTTCFPDVLEPSEITSCIRIIRKGSAVDPKTAAAGFPNSTLIALARNKNEIVGVGVIKERRPQYALRKAKASGFHFDKDTLELGYVAVKPDHQNKGLSLCIVASLVSQFQGDLFATTSDRFMKKTLRKVGFRKRGDEWSGVTERLSLWYRPIESKKSKKKTVETKRLR